jgi:hypothetical protein
MFEVRSRAAESDLGSGRWGGVISTHGRRDQPREAHGTYLALALCYKSAQTATSPMEKYLEKQ